MDIDPGTNVNVTITAAPASEAARKTLTRLFRKDPQVALQQRRRKQQRPTLQTWRRGGRQWRHQMKSVAPVALTRGASYHIRATVDVIRDLESVQRWVKVTPA